MPPFLLSSVPVATISIRHSTCLIVLHFSSSRSLHAWTSVLAFRHSTPPFLRRPFSHQTSAVGTSENTLSVGTKTTPALGPRRPKHKMPPDDLTFLKVIGRGSQVFFFSTADKEERGGTALHFEAQDLEANSPPPFIVKLSLARNHSQGSQARTSRADTLSSQTLDSSRSDSRTWMVAPTLSVIPPITWHQR